MMTSDINAERRRASSRLPGWLPQDQNLRLVDCSAHWLRAGDVFKINTRPGTVDDHYVEVTAVSKPNYLDNTIFITTRLTNTDNNISTGMWYNNEDLFIELYRPIQ